MSVQVFEKIDKISLRDEGTHYKTKLILMISS